MIRTPFQRIGRTLVAAAVLATAVVSTDTVAYQPGKDGPANVTVANTVVNQYTVLTASAGTGVTALTVTSTAGITPGDVLMVYQAQGATIDGTDTSAFGTVIALGNAGHYEFVDVAAVPSATEVDIASNCATGLRYSYDANLAQVIRVPQYTTMTISGAGSIVATPWNGSIGGVVAAFVEGAASIDGGGISATGSGFRGGVVTNVTGDSGTDWPYYRVSPADEATQGGAEKGESIAGFQGTYDTAANGRYGRGAAANGGGGGNAHNGGGGGGANGDSGTPWNGQGNPDLTDATWTAAWDLDPTLTSATVSSGGGRGGYSYGNTDQDALVVAPGDASWGGNNRRERGGLGGRPLVNDPSVAGARLFLGGGGGAGDENNDSGSSGAAGGGLVYILAGSIGGAGAISADGADAAPTTGGNNDGPGGGGGGGTVVISTPVIAGVSVTAAGGAGGIQLITNDESEGPGGGGGGGFIAHPGAATVLFGGGANGVTSSTAVTEFTPNGATRGGAGIAIATPANLPVCLLTTADLSITKTDGVTIAVPGTPITYTIVASNAGPSTATGATVVDTLPATILGATWTAIYSVGASGPASGTGDINATVTIPAGGTATFTVTGTISETATGTLSNTATVVAPSGSTDPTPGDNSATDTDTLVPSADLGVVKTGPANVNVGSTIAYTVVVTNNGPSTATNVIVTDATPAGLAFVGNSGACTTPYPCSIGSLANGASATITTTYTVPANYAGANPLTNTASVASDTPDPDPTNNQSSVQTGIAAGNANLSVLKLGPATAVPGTIVTYTLTVTNAGPDTAFNAVLGDPTPAGLIFDSASMPCSAGFPCALGDLASGASTIVTVTFAVSASATGSIANTATVGSDTPDPDPSDNVSTVTTIIPPDVASADLYVVKTGPATIAAGTDITYSLAIGNNGPDLASNVVLADPAPAGLTFVSASAPCATGFPCSLGGLANGAVLSVSVTFAVPAGATGSLANTATIGSDTPDPNPGNNISTVTSTVIPVAAAAADLVVTKTGPATALPGSTISYTITVLNQGPDAVPDAVLTDPTPAGLAYLSSGAPCAGGFPCALGAIASGASVVVVATYAVDAGFSGTLTNIASANSATITDPTPANNTSTATTTVAIGTATPPRPVPADARWMLALMAALLMLVGVPRAFRRR